MASGEGRREVPDSEDELMTSSPVNISDGAADKLSVTAPVPFQDAQDALQEAARPHQATSENLANAGDRIGGLGIDQKNASIDLDVSSTNIQPETTTAIQSADMAAASTNSRRQHAPDHEMKIEPVAISSAKTNNTTHTPEVDISDEQMNTRDYSNNATHETAVKQAEQQSSFKAIQEDTARSKEKMPESERDAIESSNCGRPAFGEGNRVPLPEPSTSQKISSELVRSRCEKTSSTESTSQILGDAPVRSHDVTGNEDTLRTSMNEGVEAQPESSDSTRYARQAATVQQEMPPNEKPGNVSSETAKDDKTLSSVPMAKPSGDASEQDINEKAMYMLTTPVENEQTGPATSFSITASQASSNSQSSTPSQPSSTNNSSTISKTPQEITLAELKAQKTAMLATLAALPAIQVLMEENASSDAVMVDGEDEPTETDIMAAANKIVKDHIKLLHEYNELKDVGQGLMGLIADQRGVRIVEVQEEFGIDAKD